MVRRRFYAKDTGRADAPGASRSGLTILDALRVVARCRVQLGNAWIQLCATSPPVINRQQGQRRVRVRRLARLNNRVVTLDLEGVLVGNLDRCRRKTGIRNSAAPHATNRIMTSSLGPG